MFREEFLQTVKCYLSNKAMTEHLWNDIATRYSENTRHYHNLTHLEHLLEQLIPIKEMIQDWHTLILSIAYHDFVYYVRNNDNEEQSASYAEKALSEISYPADKIQKCKDQILATKAHKNEPGPDTNFFTDADLSILGADTETYLTYVTQIRKEYKIYPDLLYKPGRAKVLQHFLNMERIFKTDHFYDLYEQQARKNLSIELEHYS